MGYIVSLTGLCLSFIWKKKTRSQYSPGGIFSFYWGVIALLAQIGLFGLFPVSVKMYGLVLTGIISFSLGCMMQSGIARYSCKSAVYVKSRMNQKMFAGSCIITFIGLFIIDCNAIRVMLLYDDASLKEIRYKYNGLVLKGGLDIPYKFLIYPLLLMIVVIFIAQTVQNRKINKRLCLFSFLLTLMDLLAIGDRMVLYFWLVGFLFVYMYLMKKIFTKHIVKKIKNLIIVVLILFFSVFIIRGTKNIIDSIYSYLTGGLAYSTIVWERIENGEPLIFWASYQGVLRPIMGILERIHITSAHFDEATKFLLSNQNHVVKISEMGRNFNYFTTCFAYFYRDLKNMGVIINSFLWGVVSNSIYKNIEKDRSFITIGNYIFILVSIFMGMIDYALVEVAFAWAAIFYNLHFGKKSKYKSVRIRSVTKV